jgi:hypothetical protein
VRKAWEPNLLKVNVSDFFTFYCSNRHLSFTCLFRKVGQLPNTAIYVKPQLTIDFHLYHIIGNRIPTSFDASVHVQKHTTTPTAHPVFHPLFSFLVPLPTSQYANISLNHLPDRSSCFHHAFPSHHHIPPRTTAYAQQP